MSWVAGNVSRNGEHQNCYSESRKQRTSASARANAAHGSVRVHRVIEIKVSKKTIADTENSARERQTKQNTAVKDTFREKTDTQREREYMLRGNETIRVKGQHAN